MAEIQELFSSNKTLNISTGKSTGMGIPEIALIVISGVIFIGSIILIIVIRTQWTRYKRFVLYTFQNKMVSKFEEKKLL